MAKVTDELLDHDYDGIREYDNPLPPWWVSLFFITVIWGSLYFFYYHVAELGDRSVDEYNKEFDPTWSKEKDINYTPLHILGAYRMPYHSLASDLTPKMIADRAGLPIKSAEPELPVKEDYVAFTDAENLSAGKEIYLKNCVPCHGALGEGGIGPNLTDDYWIHGAGIVNMMKVIIRGVPEKGMLSWGKLMKEEDLLKVASYAQTLHGTNPPNAKAPQGTLEKP